MIFGMQKHRQGHLQLALQLVQLKKLQPLGSDVQSVCQSGHLVVWTGLVQSKACCRFSSVSAASHD